MIVKGNSRNLPETKPNICEGKQNTYHNTEDICNVAAVPDLQQPPYQWPAPSHPDHHHQYQDLPQVWHHLYQPLGHVLF